MGSCDKLELGSYRPFSPLVKGYQIPPQSYEACRSRVTVHPYPNKLLADRWLAWTDPPPDRVLQADERRARFYVDDDAHGDRFLELVGRNLERPVRLAKPYGAKRWLVEPTLQAAEPRSRVAAVSPASVEREGLEFSYSAAPGQVLAVNGKRVN